MSTVLCWCGGDTAEILEAGTTEPVRVICEASSFHDPLATGAPSKVRKLYVAGPMTGYPDCNYPSFNRVAELLTQSGYEVVNPAHSNIPAGHYVDFLREDLRWMLDCDGVATLEGWWASAGARNEVNVAGLLQMPVRPWGEWLIRWQEELT